MLGNDITLCIAGNKVDLEKERHVTVDEAETYVLTMFVPPSEYIEQLRLCFHRMCVCAYTAACCSHFHTTVIVHFSISIHWSVCY